MQEVNITFDVDTLGKDKRPGASSQNNINGRKNYENFCWKLILKRCGYLERGRRESVMLRLVLI